MLSVLPFATTAPNKQPLEILSPSLSCPHPASQVFLDIEKIVLHSYGAEYKIKIKKINK